MNRIKKSNININLGVEINDGLDYFKLSNEH